MGPTLVGSPDGITDIKKVGIDFAVCETRDLVYYESQYPPDTEYVNEQKCKVKVKDPLTHTRPNLSWVYHKTKGCSWNTDEVPDEFQSQYEELLRNKATMVIPK